jgi:tetratricopeptide (TPR) repeat protein
MLAAPVQLFAARTIIEYTRAIEQSPEDRKYKFYLLRGLAYREKGDISSAIKDFSTSIQLKPNRGAYLKRGEMYFEKGNFNIAINDFSEAIKISPSIEAYKLRGLTSLVQGNLEMAIEDGTKIIEIAPNVSESYNIRMEAYAQIGKFKLAREDARRALSLNKRNKIASDLLVKYPEKIVLQGVGRKYESIQVEEYNIWANSQGFAFTKKQKEEQAEESSESQQAPSTDK